MEPILQILGTASVLALGAFALGFVWIRVKNRTLSSGESIPIDSVVRFKTADALYRTRFSGRQGRQLSFEAPLSRDSYVPIRVGETVTIEAPTPRGLLLFQGRISARDESTHRFNVEPTEPIRCLDRRDSARTKLAQPESVSIENASASIVDVSAKGARIRSQSEFRKGDRVRVESKMLGGALGAWIIEAAQMGNGPEATNEYRILFEEPARI